MGKRKLNTRQQKRVAAKRFTDGNNLDELSKPGLVIINFGKRVLVEREGGEEISCSVRQNLGKLVAGDRVMWQPDLEQENGIVTQLEERQRLLSRPGFRGETRMVAANISLIGIVAPVVPQIQPEMIDRYLIAAQQLQISAFLILNKSDLLSEKSYANRIQSLLEPYRDLDLNIVEASSTTGNGLKELQKILDDHTSVLVGPSGAGKSSLIKALIPDQAIRIGELSSLTGLGSHTTSNSILYHLPGDGALIDSPGVRTFSPQPCEPAELEQNFIDFLPYLGLCRFYNCIHRHEPGCAIIKAVKTGQIAEKRLGSFHKLLDEFAVVKN